MKKLMNRAGLLAAAFALALAVALALNAATHTPEVAQAQTVRGSDTDGNGLIEITTHAQLNALRYDLDGDGDMDYDLNADGIPDVSAAERVILDDLFECPPTTPECKGYELKSDISLASYDEWETIGPWWGAAFDGGGYSITGLKGNNGLFHAIATGAVVKNVNVVEVEITRDDQGGNVGALAAANHGTIIGSYVTGKITREAITAEGDIGGLVGRNHKSGKIYASVADVNIKVTAIPANIKPNSNYRSVMRVGGLVGLNAGAIHRSYAYGNLRDARTTNDRNAANSSVFKARGIAVNHTKHGGNIHWSISYGNEIVTKGDADNAEVIKDTLAKFAYDPPRERLTPHSCHLPNEWEFTCPPPTPTN